MVIGSLPLTDIQLVYKIIDNSQGSTTLHWSTLHWSNVISTPPHFLFSILSRDTVGIMTLYQFKKKVCKWAAPIQIIVWVRRKIHSQIGFTSNTRTNLTIVCFNDIQGNKVYLKACTSTISEIFDITCAYISIFKLKLLK